METKEIPLQMVEEEKASYVQAERLIDTRALFLNLRKGNIIVFEDRRFKDTEKLRHTAEIGALSFTAPNYKERIESIIRVLPKEISEFTVRTTETNMELALIYNKTFVQHVNADGSRGGWIPKPFRTDTFVPPYTVTIGRAHISEFLL